MATVLSFFATAPKGLGDLLVAELVALGATGTRESAAGASFSGPLEVAYRACLWSRVASRILLPLAEFPVASADDLYAGAAAVPWEDHLTAEGTFAVDASGSAEGVDHTHFAALKVKDAVVDRFRSRSGKRPSVKVHSPDVGINLHLARGRGTLSLDLSGGPLHQRGYRLDRGEAPLKENLAAGILLRAGWPHLAAEGRPLLDPMCGSGTLCVEAALISADAAPGAARARFGFLGWKGHQSGLWTSLQVEARYRAKEGMMRLAPVFGFDADPAAVKAARANCRRAGFEGRIRIEVRDLASLAAPPVDTTGLVVVNPPYGERMGRAQDLGAVYALLGERLRGGFAGWKAAVFTGNPELARRMGLKAFKANNLYNGDLRCRLLHFDLRADKVASPPLPEQAAQPQAPLLQEGEAGMFENRLRKNLRNLGRWARREGITCYRLYDADVPEFNLAVDVYGPCVHVQEYEAPLGIDPELAAARVRAALDVVSRVLAVPAGDVFLKVRRRQGPAGQYERQGGEGRIVEVQEGGLRFLVNLSDYIDTGLFLDARPIRALIRDQARGRRFLNLFCYTGTATVYAAAGAAESTTSVDLSNTYLEWARRNMALNGFSGPGHKFFRGDVLRWIDQERSRYGLIYLNPPIFSRSKGMAGSFDIQRDHVPLIKAVAGLLDRDGTLLFVTNRRAFVLDGEALKPLAVEDLTETTIPRDFARRPGIHRCWKISPVGGR